MKGVATKRFQTTRTNVEENIKQYGPFEQLCGLFTRNCYAQIPKGCNEFIDFNSAISVCVQIGEQQL